MLARLRVCVVSLLAIAGLTGWITPALAEAVPPGRAACAGAGHAHEAPAGMLSMHESPGACGQCGHGCGPGRCLTPGSLGAAVAPPATAPQRPHSTGYEVGSDPLRSTTATPPIPPPQRLL